MTMDQFKVIVKVIKTAYPKENVLPTPESIKLWYKMLGDLSYEQITIAVQKYILKEKFPPTIADIRKIADELTETESDWGKGWEEVRRAIRRHGVYDPSGALGSMSETTRRCVERLGWKELCLSENQAIDRANFRMLYEEVVKKEDVTLPPIIKEQISKFEKKLIEEKTV